MRLVGSPTQLSITVNIAKIHVLSEDHFIREPFAKLQILSQDPSIREPFAKLHVLSEDPSIREPFLSSIAFTPGST
jgi:hypothetical protein